MKSIIGTSLLSAVHGASYPAGPGSGLNHATHQPTVEQRGDGIGDHVLGVLQRPLREFQPIRRLTPANEARAILDALLAEVGGAFDIEWDRIWEPDLTATSNSDLLQRLDQLPPARPPSPGVVQFFDDLWKEESKAKDVTEDVVTQDDVTQDGDREFVRAVTEPERKAELLASSQPITRT